ncbi:MAG: RNA polymerase sigma factor [Vicinamibacterales bacterium]
MNDLSLDRQASGSRVDVSDDARLVMAARRDRREFAHLYERYADRLYRYALARTGSEAAADDIVSETMVAALEGIGRFDPERGTVAGWLFAIAARKVADRGRRRGRMRRLVGRLRGGEGSDEDVLETVIRGEDAALVQRLLAGLSERDRELVLLRYSAGLTSTEIAETLGISSGAARVRLTRVLQRLAAELGDDR